MGAWSLRRIAGSMGNLMCVEMCVWVHESHTECFDCTMVWGPTSVMGGHEDEWRLHGTTPQPHHNALVTGQRARATPPSVLPLRWSNFSVPVARHTTVGPTTSSVVSYRFSSRLLALLLLGLLAAGRFLLPPNAAASDAVRVVYNSISGGGLVSGSGGAVVLLKISMPSALLWRGVAEGSAAGSQTECEEYSL